MNTKKIVSTFLLLFVFASVGAIVAKETATKDAAVQTSPVPASAEANATLMLAPQNSQPQKPSEAISAPKVIAYYFHGNYRCPTCRKIEAYTTEAINNGFADDLKTGRVELKVVNVEESGNEHFVQDYQLANRSVVVARFEGDSQKDWKRLDEVWQLVEDKEAFMRFVQEQTSLLLKSAQ